MSSELIESLKQIENRIFTFRGVQVMLDSDLVELYQVETLVLNQAVKRNQERFTDDFMFQLTQAEWTNLQSQSVKAKARSEITDLKNENLISQNVISSGYGGKKRATGKDSLTIQQEASCT
jgi:hypothetical protein